jgi:hypothetical protein
LLSYAEKVLRRATTLLAAKGRNNPLFPGLRRADPIRRTGQGWPERRCGKAARAPASPQPRAQQRAGMSGSWIGDAKEGQGSRGVAGVAAQRGRRRCERRVLVGGRWRGCAGWPWPWAVPVRTWEASSAKVVSRRWCKASIPSDPEGVGEADGAGLGGGEVGDRLHAHRPPASGVQVTDLAGDADGLGGMGADSSDRRNVGGSLCHRGVEDLGGVCQPRSLRGGG